MLREHHGVADDVAARNVVRDHAVVAVHVVNGKTQVAEAVTTEQVVAARYREDPVAPVAEIVVDHFGSGRIPDRDSVAGLADAWLAQSDDLVAARDGTGGAMQVDAKQIVLKLVVLDDSFGRALLDEHTGIHRLERAAGAANFEAAHDGTRSRYRNDTTFTGSDDH